MITGLELQQVPAVDPLYSRTGPIAACCGRPFRECTCPKYQEDTAPSTAAMDRRTSEARAAMALERIATALERLAATKHQ